MKVISFCPVKFNRIELGVFVLLDIIQKYPDFLKRAFRILQEENDLDHHQNQEKGNHKDSPIIENCICQKEKGSG